MKARRALPWCLLAATAALAAPGSSRDASGWPADLASLHTTWDLRLADPARPDLWECQKLSSDTQRVLLRVDRASSGSLRAVEWSSETGVRARDLADETFWSILDAFARDAEWTETDPDGLPKSFRRTLDAPPSQGFLCRSCHPRLAAATVTRHGTTVLKIAPLTDPVPPTVAGLAAGLTDEGLRSLANQQKLSVDVLNPCQDKQGSCSMELSGTDGRKWTFSRNDGSSPWSRLTASYQAGPWWSPEWDWDSLRLHAPREFRNVVHEWISSEADLVAERLLSPLEPALAFPLSAWKARALPGLRVAQVADSVARLSAPPRGLVLARIPNLDFEIDAFGRRIVRIGGGKP